jgi:dephospho-CoA kinase
MLKIGLTGGIGSGKTTASNLFLELGIPVIDADKISHSLVKKDQPALSEIEKTFGSAIINPDGSLDRDRLRDIVFSNSDKKKLLESILHPLVYKEIRRQIETLDSPYVILSIPLLLETGMQHLVDRVLVIDCPVETQIKRVKQRNRITEEKIRSIINAQIPRTQRITAANDIIDNSGSASKLAEQIKKLHNLYLSLCES